jgi:hypothetical protein
MPKKRYGSATAQDLYRLFIRRDVLDLYPHWVLVDDDDSQDPVPDDWYVVVDIGDRENGFARRRLHAALLWAAILACASNKIEPMRLDVVQKCQQIVYERDLDQIHFNAPDVDTVMQVALLGQVVY